VNADNAAVCTGCGKSLEAVPGTEIQASLDEAGPVSAAPEHSDIDGRSAAQFVIERGDGIGIRFHLLEGESLIGRWDPDNGIFPEVDLDRHDPEAKVSRRHAKVFVREGRFFIEDLGSINGTFLNRGRRLLPGVPQVLNEDDEIIVGKTFLRFKTRA
jgi:serine/threonine-protein kinase